MNKKYTVLVGVSSDKQGKDYPIGSTITNKDFPKGVIAGWLKRGILAEVTPADPVEIEEVD